MGFLLKDGRANLLHSNHGWHDYAVHAASKIHFL